MQERTAGLDLASEEHRNLLTLQLDWPQGKKEKTADVGMAYLHHLLGAFNGDEHLALAGWYQGERSVKANGPLQVSKVFVANVLALKQRM